MAVVTLNAVSQGQATDREGYRRQYKNETRGPILNTEPFAR